MTQLVMSKSGDRLIPAKFLTLIAHLAVALTILWSSRESVKICLPEEHTQRAYDVQHTQLVLGMSLSITIILIELLAFLLGLTMFSQSSALLSIASHGCAACMLCYLVMDGMQCGWYWMIFGLFTVPPIIYDFILIADIVMNRKY